MHVLVVDDEPVIRHLLREIVADLGHRVEDCEDVRTAIRLLDSDRFDLVFSDVLMPGIDGLQFLEWSKDRREVFVLVTGCADVNTAVQALRLGAVDFVSKPFDRRSIAASVRRATRIVEERRFQTEIDLEKESVNRALLGAISPYTERTIASLVAALDARESETNHHSRRVSLYGQQLAREIGRPPALCEAIRLGGLLHDVGKIGVPDGILLKRGPLTEDEWTAMKRHTLIGAQITRSLELDPASHDVVLSHHERFDGSGYPFGLAGKDIPESARIFAIADTLDAITSDRPYRTKRSFGHASSEIAACSGSDFDPEFIQAFLRIPEKVWQGIRAAASATEVPSQLTETYSI